MGFIYGINDSKSVNFDSFILKSNLKCYITLDGEMPNF